MSGRKACPSAQHGPRLSEHSCTHRPTLNHTSRASTACNVQWVPHARGDSCTHNDHTSSASRAHTTHLRSLSTGSRSGLYRTVRLRASMCPSLGQPEGGRLLSITAGASSSYLYTHMCNEIATEQVLLCVCVCVCTPEPPHRTCTHMCNDITTHCAAC